MVVFGFGVLVFSRIGTKFMTCYMYFWKEGMKESCCLHPSASCISNNCKAVAVAVAAAAMQTS